MSQLGENLPLRRTFVEERVGQLVGIFQIDRKQLIEEAHARSLSTADMVGLVAVANGGKLSETAFNVWTTASQIFKEAGCPENGRVDFSLSEMARRVWPSSGRSADKRRRIAEALGSLLDTTVVAVGVDPYTLERKPDAVWEMNLLEAAGAQGELQPVLSAAREGGERASLALATLGSLRGSSTWSLVLPRWLADSVRENRGVILDYDVQRSLRGCAKHIWVQLESHPDWTRHVMPRPTGEEDLRDQLEILSSGVAQVLPREEEDCVEVQTLSVDLDDDAYESLGITHNNRKRDLEAACASITKTDGTYLRAEIRRCRHHGRRFELHLVRAAGTYRQERLRAALLARRRTREEPQRKAA